MANVSPTTDSRAALVDLLIYIHRMMQWNEDRWRAKAAVSQRYQPLVVVKKRWRGWTVAVWALGLTVAAFTIGVPITDAFYSVILSPSISGDLADSNSGAVIAALLAVPVVGSIGLAFAIVTLRNKVWLPREHAKALRANTQREVHNAAVWVQEQEINAQLEQVGHDLLQAVGTVFPQKYLYEEALVFCIQLVQNHRASTVTEAINVYETEMHRKRMENMQAETLAEATRARKLQAVGIVLNAAMTGAAIGTMRAEGQATRQSLSAHSSAVTRGQDKIAGELRGLGRRR